MNSRPTPSASRPVDTPPPRALVIAIATAALAIFLVQAWPLRSWIIDDAGVSFAYARNLAMGFGLVSQPGVPPVEGFSNPLWTLILTLCLRLGAFDPLWTPKILSVALVGVALLLMAADLLRRGTTPFDRVWPAVVGTVLTALSASFVIWTTSGLENGLLAALAAASCVACARARDDARSSPVLAGVLAGLLALTRPDAAIYIGAFPLLLLLTGGLARAQLAQSLRRLGSFAAGAVPIACSYLLFRRWYFGHWVPNTFVAKDKPSLAYLLDDSKWAELFDAALGPAGLAAMAVVIVAAIVGARRPRRDARAVSLGVHLALAMASYMLMPLDWMGEFRFASAFFLFFAWALGLAVAEVQRSSLRAPRLGAAILGLAAIGMSVADNTPRARDFAKGPVTPFSHVVSFYGSGFNQLAEALPDPHGSILAPDMGGTLLTSHLRVYDLVGLCDATTARTLNTDTRAFHHYVLDEVRPTFIHVHQGWATLAAFHQSPRFHEDYLAIAEVWGPPGGPTSGEPKSGDYVRRDALGPAPEAMLARLQAIYRAAGLDRITL